MNEQTATKGPQPSSSNSMLAAWKWNWTPGKRGLPSYQSFIHSTNTQCMLTMLWTRFKHWGTAQESRQVPCLQSRANKTREHLPTRLPCLRVCTSASPTSKVYAHSPRMNQIPISDAQTGTQEPEAGPSLDLVHCLSGTFADTLLGEAESQGPWGPALWQELHGSPAPHLMPGTDGSWGCSSWDMPGPTPFTLGPLSSKPARSPQAALVMSALGRERRLGVRLLSERPQGLAGERPGSLFRIKKFSQDCHSHHLLFTPNILDYCLLYFHLKKKKQAHTELFTILIRLCPRQYGKNF